MIVGIDFSINSTAVSIKNGESVEMFSFVPNYRSELAAFRTHSQIADLAHIHSYPKASNTKDAILDQSIKLQNADHLSDLIINTISEHITGEARFFIEGFSFGSKGNSFIDLITYNTFLKVKIIQKWGHHINVISPKTLKKFYTGNGNASKCDMLRSYLEKNENPFKTKLVDLGLQKDGEFNIPKPVDDLIDSIALCEWGFELENA